MSDMFAGSKQPAEMAQRAQLASAVKFETAQLAGQLREALSECRTHCDAQRDHRMGAGAVAV